MKDYKYRKIDFPSLILKLVAMLAVSAFMAACSGNDDGGNNNGYIYGYGANNIANPAQVTTVYSQNPMNGVSLILGTTVDNTMYYNSTSLNIYNGPVAFIGTMNVQANWYDFYSSCQVPPGSYTVQSVNSSAMSAGMLAQAVLVANPGNIILEVNAGMINGNRLVALPPGGIRVAQSNGINCSAYFGGSFN
ncbi:hypothetical protein [Bdellovibrio sp. HCB209]|uniref:hypothetical protein n=1 Tax=Bdellovibrio sp. HCB209 TaxID=3394354 RepID=UPI0039B6A6A3